MHPADPSFRLDFVTPMDRTGKDLIMIPAFNAQFQALRYMEFSIEGVRQAAVFSRACETRVVGPPTAATSPTTQAPQ